MEMTTSVSTTASPQSILEMGCGKRKVYPDSIGLDICVSSHADVIHDLNDFPYPFEDSKFDIVTCIHVLEHLNDVIKTVEEIHRILKSGGLLIVEVPYFTSSFAYSDPTHKHFFTSRSFDYFLPDTAVSEFDYANVRFNLKKCELMINGDGLLRSQVKRWIDSHIRFYEEHLAFIFPRHALRFELEAIK